MLERFLYVGFENRPTYPKKSKIAKIFGVYGNIQMIISNSQFKNYFFIEFKCRRYSSVCYEHRCELYEKYGFIVEHIHDHQDVYTTEHGGPADYSDASLMDINDDCLLHILSLLPLANPLEYACLRLRRLSKSKWKKVNFLETSDESPNLDRIFHCGSSLHHLSVSYFDATFKKILYLIWLHCLHIRRLSLIACKFNPKFIAIIKKKLPTITELVLDRSYGYEYKMVKVLPQSARRLEKLRISGQVCIFDDANFFKSLLTKMTSLTTLIMPKGRIDVAKILRKLPQLRVLACAFDDDSSSALPVRHGLCELHANIKLSKNVLNYLISIRETCPKLRHLRISKAFDDECCDRLLFETLKKMVPLDGLIITRIDITQPSFISFFADKLKFVFFYGCRLPEEYPILISRYSLLEIVSWDSFHGNLDAMLSRRTSNGPLTIVCPESPEPTVEQKRLLPALKWEKSFEDIFGSFRVYSYYY